MDFGRWDFVDVIIALFAVAGCVSVASWILTRGQASATKEIPAAVVAILCTAAAFGWMPYWPIILLLMTLLVLQAALTPEFRRRENWTRALALVAVAVLLLASGLGRLTEQFGHPEWLGYQDTLKTVAFLLLAPSLLSGVLDEAKPGDRRLLRFLGRSLMIPALLAGLAFLLEGAGVLREWQALALLVAAVVAWGMATLAYIFTGGFGRGRKEQRPDTGRMPPHATQR